jgi:hypothetical protein
MEPFAYYQPDWYVPSVLAHSLGIRYHNDTASGGDDCGHNDTTYVNQLRVDCFRGTSNAYHRQAFEIHGFANVPILVEYKWRS